MGISDKGEFMKGITTKYADDVRENVNLLAEDLLKVTQVFFELAHKKYAHYDINFIVDTGFSAFAHATGHFANNSIRRFSSSDEQFQRIKRKAIKAMVQTLEEHLGE